MNSKMSRTNFRINAGPGIPQVETQNSRPGISPVFRGFLSISLLSIMLLVFPGYGIGSSKKKQPPQSDHLTQYLERVRAMKAPTPIVGSMWTPQSPYSDLASDYKARNINDLIVIRVVESTTAADNSSVKSARNFSANSGISAGMGLPGATSGLQNIFSPHSARALDGQAQTSSDSALSTSLSGRVVEVLPNGFLVIEAVRQMFMNNQRQTVIIHGVVRPGDINSANAVASTAISNLEVELKGKGVVSDGVAPPNKVMGLILKLVGF
jgi:flagellar L-ring protein FlgH